MCNFVVLVDTRGDGNFGVVGHIRQEGGVALLNSITLLPGEESVFEVTQYFGLADVN